MLKHYFTDGLVQIAIVLSLLRTDLNNYLNHNYVNYPEVQEIIQGQTVAYTQANFHSSYNTHLGSPEIYRKNIDLSNSTFYRDLRSFQPASTVGNEIINVPTFLLIGGSSNAFTQDTNNEQTDNEDENNNVELDSSTIEDLEAESHSLLNILEESIGAIAPVEHLHGDDPTNEDLDLIEVLWRQDIDLGVGKEVFDPNLRRELEREREIELQKERQKQKDQEQLQVKLEEQRHNAQQRWLHDNFTQDGETGEWIPQGGSRVPPPPAPGDLTNIQQQPTVDQFLPNYDAFGMMGDGLPQEANTNYNVVPNHPPPQYPAQPMQQQTQGMYNTNISQYNHPVENSSSNHSVGYPHQAAQRPCTLSQTFQQQQNQYNNSTSTNYTHHPHNISHVQNVSHHQAQAPPQHQHQVNVDGSYPRQSSLEATWQDLVHLLDLPATNRTVAPQQQPNNTAPHHSITQMSNTSSMLIQNASMPTPAPMGENVTFMNTGMISQCRRTPPHSSGMLSPCAESFNSSMPSGSGSSIEHLDWDSCGDLFPNISSELDQTDVDVAASLEDVDELLPDLITEDELDDIKISEMGLSDGMTPTPGSIQGDEASSDSAVSMGSQSIGSPDHSDLSDAAMSPFDGMEGATGGSPFSKSTKYEPDEYKYGNSCSYSSGGDSDCSSNFSSNDTGSSGHFSNGHNGFPPTNNGHFNHNHTYPLKPGSDPKDFKKHHMYNREGRHKGPQSKDHKRIAELKVPYSVDQIVDSPVEEFNEMVTSNKFSDQQLQLIRDIRRRGKNKVAAQNCRKRKIGVLEHLEDEMGDLEKMRDKLIHDRHLMDKQTREMKEKLGLMYSQIFHSLRDDQGQPYDPSRFSLQQSSDGDVFLVPRNYTTDDDVSKKKKSDKK